MHIHLQETIGVNGVSGQTGANARQKINVGKGSEAESVTAIERLDYLLQLAMNLAQLSLKNALVEMVIVQPMLMSLITLHGLEFEKKDLDHH